MAEHIYVNVQNSPCRVCLSSGAGYMVKPGHAVRGEHFLRTAATGLLIPIEGLPANRRRSIVIHDPEGVVGVLDAPKSEDSGEAPPSVEPEGTPDEGGPDGEGADTDAPEEGGGDEEAPEEGDGGDEAGADEADAPAEADAPTTTEPGADGGVDGGDAGGDGEAETDADADIQPVKCDDDPKTDDCNEEGEAEVDEGDKEEA